MDMPDDATMEFKLVNVKGQGDPQWEKGKNRKLVVGHDDLQVEMSWGKTDNGAVAPAGGEAKAMQAASEDQSASSGGNSGDQKQWEPPRMDYTSDSSSEAYGDQMPQNGWQGKQIHFMTENNHTGDRSGTWDTTGLEGPILALVKGDEQAAR